MLSRLSLVCRGCGCQLWWSWSNPWAYVAAVGGAVAVVAIAFGAGYAVQPYTFRETAWASGSPCWWFGYAVEYGLLAVGLVAYAAAWPWIWPYTRIKPQDAGAKYCWQCRFDVRANPAGPCSECGAELNYTSSEGA